MKWIRELIDRNFESIMDSLFLLGVWGGLAIICTTLMYLFGVL